MNLMDPKGIVHLLDACLRPDEDSDPFNILIECGFTLSLHTQCAKNVTVASMTKTPVNCIACLAKT